MQWFDTPFTPKGCKIAINGPTVTVASGHVWEEVYSAASARRLSVVGGYSPTVGVAGFLSNGGHGKFSAKYGYGADMVLQIELVTASGDIITANECQNQEYFWAMRGVSNSLLPLFSSH
jgi:FAD/FMN-containing dehydrogenase